MLVLKKKQIEQLYANSIKKRKLANELAGYLELRTEELFYEYMKGNLSEQGLVGSGVEYHFHGLGCTIKTGSDSVELEFGPNGKVDAFDKYTLCHDLGFEIDEADNLIGLLLHKKIVEMVDEKLYRLVNKIKVLDDGYSVEKQIDSTVADRYILKS